MAKSFTNDHEVSLIAFVNNRVDNKTPETNGQIFFQFKCPHCDRVFKSTKSNLTRHIQSIHIKKQYHCSVRGCQTSFTRIDKLKEHTKSHGNITSKY